MKLEKNNDTKKIRISYYSCDYEDDGNWSKSMQEKFRVFVTILILGNGVTCCLAVLLLLYNIRRNMRMAKRHTEYNS